MLHRNSSRSLGRTAKLQPYCSSSHPQDVIQLQPYCSSSHPQDVILQPYCSSSHPQDVIQLQPYCSSSHPQDVIQLQLLQYMVKTNGLECLERIS